ncbi:MAG: hypothetical protein H8D82_02105 [Euryarchaeota archaeon]|nr:hypothetical protein [Euryarchaeota archaeon]
MTKLESEEDKPSLLISVFIALLATLIISTSFGPMIVKPRLYDGSINELGRYAMTFDAYEHISETSDSVVIALGSSKMREAFDGVLIEELSSSDYDFYNLAYGLEHPYVRVIEIESIIKLNPKIVIFEIGPNTFSKLSTPVPEWAQMMMAQLIALGGVNNTKHLGEIIDPQDLEILPQSQIERMELIATYVPEAIEYTLKYELGEETPYSCFGNESNVRCVPPPTNSTFDSYLRYPPQLPNILALVKENGFLINSNGQPYDMPIEAYYSGYLDRFLNRTYHNPEGHLNKNQVAFEYMMNRLIDAGIEVVLLGLPYNPVLLERLAVGQWDYYNTSVAGYSQIEGVTVLDMMWDSGWIDDEFSDYTHMSRQGEIKLAGLLVQPLDEILRDS